LWESSKPLQKKIKFVWIPVRIINASSLTQGAALLGAADPLALMSEHEASLLGGKGGIAASASVAPELDQAIQRNTQLLTSFGAESVPFIVARSLGTGQLVRREGALDTVALAGFLGIPL
jgi:thiol:disulfide interchange protein DsbG